ncbi:hypothetical protein Ac2012v2_000599 [Leucoagaricus gongylophorus]
MAFKERAIDDSQDCCNNASGVRHIPELCQINSYMYMFKGQGIDKDVPTRDVLVWETLEEIQPRSLIGSLIGSDDWILPTHSGPSSVCRQSRDSGTILSRAIFISTANRC